MDICHIGSNFLTALTLGNLEKDFSIVMDIEGHTAVITSTLLILPDEFETSRKTCHSHVEFPLDEVIRINIRVLSDANLAVANNRDVVNSE